MRWRTLACGLATAVCIGAPAPGVRAADSDAAIVAKINATIARAWKDNEVTASPRAADGEFARRVCLDILGRIPSYAELTEFLDDESPDKRAQFIDKLLAHEDYIRNWTNIWGNMLVGRANNRRGNRGALDRWLRRAIYRNQPYDKFAYDLISAEGSVQENGAVAFLASHLNEGGVPATSITSRVFLGMQVQCTQCHNHPFNDWKQAQFWSMNGFFRGTSRGRGAARGQFSLLDNPVTGVVFYEKRAGILQATQRRFVDGTRVKIDEDAKPRKQLADLVTDSSKPFLARTQVNRLWGHFFGFGFTKPVDDMGPHNPPSHPDLMNYLAKQFQEAGYDNKRLMRWIALSDAYNLTSRFNEGNKADDPAAGTTPLFSHMYLKQFRAEQLYDSLLVATAADKASRTSEAAENQRRTWLRQFIQTFGTDENDESTTFNGTIPQALVLMNGSLIKSALSGGDGSFLRRVVESPTGDLRPTKKKKTSTRPLRPTKRQLEAARRNRYRNIQQKIETLFMVALARKPTENELEAIDKVYQETGKQDPIQGLQDVFWAILNSNEFIINH